MYVSIKGYYSTTLKHSAYCRLPKTPIVFFLKSSVDTCVCAVNKCHINLKDVCLEMSDCCGLQEFG